MRNGGSCIKVAALAAGIVFFASAAFAFSVRIGSFHIVIGSHWHRHHHHFIGRGRPAAPEHPQVHPAAARSTASALLYPQLALPDVAANIFSSPSAWPFEYRSIVQAAFTRPEPESAQLCEPQSNLADRFLVPLDAALELTDTQAQLLDKLGDALDAASNSLARSCPAAVPSAPVARLQLIDSQIGQLATAVGGLRQPLQDFQHQLTDEQLARFAAMIAASSANNAGSRLEDIAPGCGGDAGPTTDQAIALIDQAVQPTAAQRDALDAFKVALGDAAKELQTDCAAPLPATELGRLGLVETRLDTMRRVTRSIEAALTRLKAALSDEQKARLDAASLVGPR